MPRGYKNPSAQAEARPRLRTHETYLFRLRVIDFFSQSNDMDATLANFFKGVRGTQLQTKRKSVYFWRRNRAKIEAMCSAAATARSFRSRQLSSATALPAEAEERLVMWVNGMRSDGIPVFHFMLQARTLEVAAAFNIPAGFSATWSWRTSFVRRHEISFRTMTRVGQVAPDDATAVAESFGKKLKVLMDKYDVDCIFNADQTAVSFEYIPKTTVNKKGAKTVWVRTCGQDKDRVIAMLLGDSLGRKYTPFVVMKMRKPRSPANLAENERLRHGFGKRVWSEIDSIQRDKGMQVYANDRGWWNSALTIAFLRYHFGDRTAKDRPILLLLDDFSGHWTDEVVEYAAALRVELVKVPLRYTSVCQPADIAWNRPLKSSLRKYWVEFMREQVTALVGDRATRIKGPGRQEVSSWLQDAWVALSARTISNGFKGILSSYDADFSDGGPAEHQGQLDELVSSLERWGFVDSACGEVNAGSDIVDSTLCNPEG